MIPLSRSLDKVESEHHNDTEVSAQEVNDAVTEELQEYQTILLNSSVLVTTDSYGEQLDSEFVGTIWDHAVKRQEDQTILVVDNDDCPLLEQFMARFPSGAGNERLVSCVKVLQPLGGVSLSFGLGENGKDVQIASFMASGVTSVDQVWKSSLFAKFYKTSTEKEQTYLSLKPTIGDYAKVRDCERDAVWRQALKKCGVPKCTVREILSGISAIMLLGNDSTQDFHEACVILGLQPTIAKNDELIVSLYNRLIAKLVSSVNETLENEYARFEESINEVSALITLIQMQWDKRSRNRVMHCVFNDDFPLNREMISEGLNVPRAPRGVNSALHTTMEVAQLKDIPQLEGSTLFCGKVPSDIDFAAVTGSSRVWTIMAMPGDRSVVKLANQFHFDKIVTRARRLDYTADFDHQEFLDHYAREFPGMTTQHLQQWAESRGFDRPQFAIGKERIWISEACWKYLETKRSKGYSPLMRQSQLFTPPVEGGGGGGNGGRALSSDYGEEHAVPFGESQWDEKRHMSGYKDIEQEAQMTSPVKMDYRRRVWLGVCYFMTWMIPDKLLKQKFKTKQQRIAWREKLAICMMIAFINCFVVFYMIFFGKLLCPNYDKVWNVEQVGHHQGQDDFYVAIHGKVYDMSKFYKQQHSDIDIKTEPDIMLQFAGKEMSHYFPKPLYLACPGLVDDEMLKLDPNKTIEFEQAVHYSGKQTRYKDSKLADKNWFDDVLRPSLKKHFKGDLVVSKKDLDKKSDEHSWAMVNDRIYDLTDYMHTLDRHQGEKKYTFLNDDLKDLFVDHAGEDITDKLHGLNLSPSEFDSNMNCLNQAFYAGKVDFRDTVRCQISNYVLLVVAVIVGAIVFAKFFAAFQYTINKSGNPPMQSRFVVCHVPVYTEGENEMRRAIDSLTALKYPNEKKLLFVVCDGKVTGEGEKQSTPEILMRLFGRDLEAAEKPKAYKAVGKGTKQLNYAQVYSGLYEYGGDLVPYIVVVKDGGGVDHDNGNRGKRDSQLVVLNFFNKVYHQTAMSPLELELFDQINNVIGVDPELYQYLFMIDADTAVEERSLSRLVADCVRDTSVAGICGETRLDNEDESFWTMMQVYEYYISHHLTKAFESLFGSVTCLPGCFSMYRLYEPGHTKPLIIHNSVIKDYYEVGANTLHQQNLLSLGEDRFLSTLMAKNFPKMRFTFEPKAVAHTRAPSKFLVLISQRRRWINSTVHNLVELLRLPDLCGFCCFGMRFFVFVDLAGTVLLPSVCVYLGYLIYLMSSHTGAFPYISMITLGAVYGLQAILFVFQREWQHIGWMVFYLLSYPVHSFVLPLYSFWKQDDFTWGQTRKLEGGEIVECDDDDAGVFEERMVPRQLWTAYALVNGRPGAHRDEYLAGKEAYVSSSSPSLPAYEDTLLHHGSRHNSRAWLLGDSSSSEQYDSQQTLIGGQKRQLLVNAVEEVLAIYHDNLGDMTYCEIIERVEMYLNTKLQQDQIDVVNEHVELFTKEMDSVEKRKEEDDDEKS